MHQRYLLKIIEEFLVKRMVFIGGPRQVGKTTLCLSFLDNPDVKNQSYLNWDDIHSKANIRNGILPSSPLVILDEIHKYKHWRSLVKGFFDKNRGTQNYLITGSARLDHYRRGGDSLLGRYRYLRLHPLSLNELKITNSSDLSALLKFGGFPEPFFSQSDKEHKLWIKERLYRVVNDDIKNLENLKDYSLLEVLAESLNSRVGSLLSVKSLEEDLQVTQKTVASWIDILEKIYYVYRVYPYCAQKIKAIKKSPKLYFWDWSEVESNGARFENLVASSLLKYCNFLEDSEGEKMTLSYLRDTLHREVDFVVLKNKKPLFAVECKTGEAAVSKSILYFKDRVAIPSWYQVHMGTKDYLSRDGVRVLPFIKFCQELDLP